MYQIQIIHVIAEPHSFDTDQLRKCIHMVTPYNFSFKTNNTERKCDTMGFRR